MTRDHHHSEDRPEHHSERHSETKAVRGAADLEKKNGPVATPIYQTSTFEVVDNEEQLRVTPTDHFYTRYGNPTNTVAEQTIAELEGVEAALKPFEGGGCLLDRSSLLITDMKLPNGHSGLELLAYLRTHNLSIPVIAMSAMFNTPGWPREQEVRSAGASEVMYKPLDLDELSTVLQKYIHHA